MSDGGLRRAVWAVLGYGASVWVIVLAADWFRRVLALPAIFETLLHGMLAVGLPVTIALAWHYPRLGAGDTRSPEGPGRSQRG